MKYTEKEYMHNDNSKKDEERSWMANQHIYNDHKVMKNFLNR